MLATRSILSALSKSVDASVTTRSSLQNWIYGHKLKYEPMFATASKLRRLHSVTKEICRSVVAIDDSIPNTQLPPYRLLNFEQTIEMRENPSRLATM